MTASHDPVRYSLLGDHDGTPPDEDLEQDTFQVKTTMKRPSLSSGPSTVNMFSGRLRGTQRITFLAILSTAFIVIIWLLSQMDTTESQTGDTGEIFFTNPSPFQEGTLLKPDGSLKASDLKVEREKEDAFEWYQNNCFVAGTNELGRSISDIFKKLQLLKTSSNERCRSIWEIFDNILRIDEVEAPIFLPKPFQTEVKGWLENNDDLFQQVKHQVIYKIVNKGTYEETVINPIRSRRPVSKSSVDPLVYIQNLTETTRPGCDFCKYKDHTAEDSFGRIDNEFSASSSNTFKLAKFHALFFPKQHYPLNLTLIQLQDLFLHTSKQWFEKAHSTDQSQRFPSLMWDCLPHAGASQVHPHIHGVLDAHQYVGGFESWHQVSLQYYNKFRRSYWSDFVKLHVALGLGVPKGDAIVLVPLAARKDHEFMILSPNLNEDVVSLIHSVLQAYQNQLNVYCFSSGGVYPKLGADDIAGMPVIFRFGSRGTCSAVGSDVSSLELYTINNINSDFSKTFDGLMEEIV